VKLESLNCLMTFDFVPSAILVIMSPCVSVPLARLEQYIIDSKNDINRVETLRVLGRCLAMYRTFLGMTD
jgi:hypothetical protein